jgi:hypothetical protein
MTALESFRGLVALAEAECAMVAAGRFDELGTIDAEWRERLATLPAARSAEERVLLERALALTSEAAARTRAALAETARELAELDGARSGVRAYAPAEAPALRVLDEAA